MLRFKSYLVIFTLAAVALVGLSGCEEDTVDPDNSPTDTTQTDTTDNDTLSPVNTARNAVIQDYNNVYLASEVTSLGWTGDADNCNAGTLPKSVHDKVFTRINYFRNMAGVEPITGFRSAWNTKSQEAALMMKANNALDHDPPSSWSCYTVEGAEAAGKANLSLGSSYHTTRALDGQMRDAGASNTAVGHRRWILYSRGEQMGHGSTDQSMVLWVIGGSATPDTMPEMVAWPPEGYVPKQHVWPRWSLGVPDADFSNGSVTMTGPNGNISLSIEPITDGFGDNTIVWVPNGIDPANVTNDATYTITVSDVELDGQMTDYTYDVTIIDPANTEG